MVTDMIFGTVGGRICLFFVRSCGQRILKNVWGRKNSFQFLVEVFAA
jgi:hypothetical protein